MSTATGPAPTGRSGSGALVLDVDLALEVTDGTGRRTSGRLVGSGSRLRMTVADPAVVVAATGRGAGHPLADLIADVGVHAELHGPRGRVATIDPEGTSRLGSLVTGSSRVVLDRSAWALALRARWPSARGVALGTAAVVVVAAGIRWLVRGVIARSAAG